MKNSFLHKETDKFYYMFCQFEANSMDTLFSNAICKGNFENYCEVQKSG